MIEKIDIRHMERRSGTTKQIGDAIEPIRRQRNWNRRASVKDLCTTKANLEIRIREPVMQRNSMDILAALISNW